MFANGYPNDELNRLAMGGTESRAQAMRLIAKAASWNMMDPTCRLAKTAQQFVKSEAATSGSNAAVWSELMPEAEITPEDRARAYRLWKQGDGAALELQLKRDNPVSAGVNGSQFLR
jgi:hypothetical protein